MATKPMASTGNMLMATDSITLLYIIEGFLLH